MSKRVYKGQKSAAVQKELESISEDLSKIDMTVSYEVPKGYWEEQEAIIMQQIRADDSNELKKKTKYKRIWYISSVAAVILALIWTYPRGVELSETELSLDSIELSALEEYLLDEAGSLDAKLSLDDTFYDQELWSNEVLQTESNE